jgi:hypothetical protein
MMFALQDSWESLWVCRDLGHVWMNMVPMFNVNVQMFDLGPRLGNATVFGNKACFGGVMSNSRSAQVG